MDFLREFDKNFNKISLYFGEKIDENVFNSDLDDEIYDNLLKKMLHDHTFVSYTQKIYQYGDYKKNKPLLRKQKPRKSLKWQIEMFKETCEQINYYVNMVKPQKRLILCVDGVAGFAKIAQQRQRRFKSAKDAEKSEDTWKHFILQP